MTKIRYGMVVGGPGAFIGEVHRGGIALDTSADLVAGAFSRSESKNVQFGEELGISPDWCYKDYQAMAAGEKDREDGIDFVVIVTPNNTHYEIAKTFLEAGINVSCDKPLCVSVEQAKKLQAFAKEHDLLFMVTFTYTGYSLVRYLAQYIQDRTVKLVKSEPLWPNFRNKVRRYRGWLVKKSIGAMTLLKMVERIV